MRRSVDIFSTVSGSAVVLVSIAEDSGCGGGPENQLRGITTPVDAAFPCSDFGQDLW
jgi:hypothetical protein